MEACGSSAAPPSVAQANVPRDREDSRGPSALLRGAAMCVAGIESSIASNVEDEHIGKTPQDNLTPTSSKPLPNLMEEHPTNGGAEAGQQEKRTTRTR